MMRAALTFVPMTLFAALALDVAVPALILLVCVLCGRAATAITGSGARGDRA